MKIDPELLKHATPEELDAYRQALLLELTLSSPLDYAVEVSAAERFDHVVLLNEWIVALMAGNLYFDGPGPAPEASGEYDEDGWEILTHPTRGDRPVYNLSIDMPPRHGKSFLVSEHLPAWFLTKYPDYHVILASYEADFAAEWGAKARDHVVDHPEHGIEVDGGKNAARSIWKVLNHRGQMKTAGAGGPLTGSGGHLIVVDDPIKNAEEAMSETYRNKMDAWWRTTLYTRREPWHDGTPGRVILMATRWHEDDLSGRRVPDSPTKGDRWAKLSLQGIFEPDENHLTCLLGREPGQALCSRRMPLAELESVREDMGENWFQAMYQGQPYIAEGNLISRPYNYFTEENGVYSITSRSGSVEHFDAKECYRFATLDLAASKQTWADWTVFMTFAVTRSTPRRLLVIGIERERAEVDNHEILTVQWFKKWTPRFIGIEDKTFGTNLISRIIRRGDISVRKLVADKDKITRAIPIDNAMRNELVFFPKNAEWLQSLESEVLKFPNVKHDDQVDALSYGVQLFELLPRHVQKTYPDLSPEGRARANIEKKARENTKKRKQRTRRIVPQSMRW